MLRYVQAIDSHTGGEPTRVVIEGGPELGSGSLSDRLACFREHHDRFRSAVVNEPRGSDVLVGALLTPPTDSRCAAGAIFFNNVGYLGMCGHGTIGLAVTLAHLGRIGVGVHHLETPVGTIAFEYHGAGKVSLENVPSYRLAKQVAVQVEGLGVICGDIAWGGNWFFLVKEHAELLDVRNAERLTQVTWSIRQALEKANITGTDGAVIDHIELFGPPHNSENHSRNFVLCPGKAYDRSPCGTGTSAKLACLAADGELLPGQIWRQESILGSVFEGIVRREGAQVIPRITGSAFITAETKLVFDPQDSFQEGIR